MRVLTIKMDCCQTAITQLTIDGRDILVEKTLSFLSYLGYTKIKNPEVYAARVRQEVQKHFPLYKKSKLILIVPPDFCEERFLRDPDLVRLAKEEGSPIKNFTMTGVGLGAMYLVTEKEARQIDPLILAFCSQGLIPNFVVSPLYAAWKLTSMLIPQKEEMLIVHPTMQNLSYTLIKDGVPSITHFGEASIAGFISKLQQQDIDEIKAMQMMVVFGVEPLELTDSGFDYREYPVQLVEGKVTEELPKEKKKGRPKKEKPEKPKKEKPEKKRRKNQDINNFSLDDLSMTDMQYETFNSGVNQFSGELKTEIALYLDDFKDGIRNFMVTADFVTDLNMRIHDCSDIAEYVLSIPSGMVLKGNGVQIHNQSLEDLKTAQMLSIGAAFATYEIPED